MRGLIFLIVAGILVRPPSYAEAITESGAETCSFELAAASQSIFQAQSLGMSLDQGLIDFAGTLLDAGAVHDTWRLYYRGATAKTLLSDLEAMMAENRNEVRLTAMIYAMNPDRLEEKSEVLQSCVYAARQVGNAPLPD